MLYNKESYIAKLKKAVYALLGLDHGNAVIRDCQYVNQEFSGFLVGKSSIRSLSVPSAIL